MLALAAILASVASSPTAAVAAPVAVENARIECADPADCHPGVGLLLIYTKTETEEAFEECTSFLIAPDLVMTNSHCIPPELKAPRSSCRGRIWTVLPGARGFAPALAECEQVVMDSGIDSPDEQATVTHEADYAVLKLTRALPGPRFLPVATQGLPDGLPVRVYQVNARFEPPTDELPEREAGEQVTARCTVAHGVSPLESFDHPLRPSGALVPCKSISGNSGSPVVDAAGAVRGIVHAILVSADGSQAPDVTYIHNLACIPLTAASSLSPHCAVTPSSPEAKQLRKQHLEQRYESGRAQLKAELDNWAKSYPWLRWESQPLFLWLPVATPRGNLPSPDSWGLAHPYPKCVSKNWQGPGSLKQQLELPVWEGILDYDSLRRWRYRQQRTALTIPAEVTVSGREAVIELRSPLATVQLGASQSLVLGVCAD